jgi:nicotinate dehydrogenase subunit A
MDQAETPTFLTINGAAFRVTAPEDTPLLTVLRNELDLRSARFGCGHEQCGACMVLLDGAPVYSCTLPIGSVGVRAVTTVEGLGSAAMPHAIQTALLAEQAGQCGYCLSGIQISAASLLARNPAPSRDEINAALDPHLCRCGAHLRIVRAVERAAALIRAGEPA